MSADYILSLDDERAILETVGGKGASLSRMVNAGLPVPVGFHITTEAYWLFVKENGLQRDILKAIDAVDATIPETLEAASKTIRELFVRAPIPLELANELMQAYDKLPGSAPAVAVRSSATAEDLPEASFAGQQDTYLNVIGPDVVLEAVRKCWASLWTARAIGYRARRGIPAESVALAVVVQTLVPAEAAGILFTANPLNGRRDQMVINASWGLGESVVGGLVTPDTLTLEKSTGVVIKRETAEKTIQTVRIEGGTKEMPVPETLRRAPVLSDNKAAELAHLGEQIETLYGMPMDIEWTLADGKFAIVQARPVTALAAPETTLPDEWKLPKGAYAAMRNNIVELMADPLTPLFRTLGLRSVNNGMNRQLSNFFGRTGILPDEPIIAINEYAYYNGSVKFGPMFRIILDTGGILKRMFTGAVERWTEEGRPRYVEIVEKWESSPWRELSSTELLEAVRQLSEAAIDAYVSLVSGIIPAAWMSEAWFTLTYKLVRRKDDPPAPVYLMGYDSTPIQAEKALYDLARWVDGGTPLAAYLRETDTSGLISDLGSDQAPPEIDQDAWQAWKTRFQAYLKQYGHMIYNLDFGNPVPADDPAPVLETFKLFLSDQGSNPHERQGATAKRREEATQNMLIRLKGWRWKFFLKNLERAQKYAPLREDGLADVGLSYPLLREMLRELGSRFTKGGMIERQDDVFWLIEDEVEGAAAQLDRGEALPELSEVIPGRKATWRAARRLTPPMALTQITIFGKDLMRTKSKRVKEGQGDTLKGVAASPGSATGTACVINGPEDFSKMKSGDILVAPLTTPAWTPLFARAAAIVTDLGGPLSHGSIVAREYGIPAVLGTGEATKRIRSGQRISVDGSAGIVRLTVYPGEPLPPA